MAFSGCMPCIDMLVFQATAMAEQHIVGFGPDTGACPFPTEPVAAATAAVASLPPLPVVDAVPAPAECVDQQRRSRRRISNRESARRSRARKQRHLDELRGSAALLELGNRDLAARAEAARCRVAVALLANAALRAEADALSRRLADARRALVDLGRLYYAGAAAVASTSVDGDCCLLGPTDIDEQMVASLIA